MSKLVVPGPKRRIQTVERIADVDNMFENLLNILGTQIEKQRINSAAGTFTEKEMKVIGELADSLVKLSREERERLKSDALRDALKDLSDEEIAALMLKEKKG